MAETEAQAGEVVSRSPAPVHHAHAVTIHLRVHAPPPRVQAESMPESPYGSEEEQRVTYVDIPFAAATGIPFPRRNVAVRSSSATTTIQRIPQTLKAATKRGDFAAPIAVAIGPYHHGSPHLQEMEDAKQVARDEFCRVADQPPEAVRQKIASLEADARRCYAADDTLGDNAMDGDGGGKDFAEIMFTDGCFLLQFMTCMCDDDGAPADGLWAKVHAHVNAIARDVMLLENQLPWLVLQALMRCTPGVSWPVLKFLRRMARAFDVGTVGNGAINDDDTTTHHPRQQQQPDHTDPPPPHLLGLFHGLQVGAARTGSPDVPRLSSVSSTAVELKETGVKISASKARVFGEMDVNKRRRLGLFGELTLAPVVLDNLTACWLFNLAEHEACQGAAHADNFAVSSYVSVVAMLMNRHEDVQELRGEGIVVSALPDEATLAVFKDLAAHVRVGYRYYDVFQRLQEYRTDRWLWIAVHRFLYRNMATIVSVLSAVGVLAGLFQAILSLKQPQK